MEKTNRKILSIVMTLMLLLSTLQLSAAALSDDARADLAVTDASDYYEVSLEAVEDSYTFALFALNSYTDSYGAQLDEFSRKIYNDFVGYYAVNRGKGEIVTTFTEPIVFDAVVKNNAFVDTDPVYVEIKEAIGVAYLRALYAFIYDYPQVFWFKGGSHSISIDITQVGYKRYEGEIKKATFTPEEILVGASSEIAAFDNAVSSAINVVAAKFDADATRQEKLKIIHDYICNETDYGLPSNPAAHTAGAFFLNECDVVCEGYAKAFKIFCDAFGIPCACISGDTDGAHMWNYVKMEDGKWYLVDVTWDDQKSRIYDTYFLAYTNKTVFNNQLLCDERTEEKLLNYFEYPVLSETEYVPHTHSYSVTVSNLTCTTPGFTKYTCICGDEYIENYTAAPGHSYQAEVIKVATHLETGIVTYSCWCGHSYNSDIPKTAEHTFVVTGTSAPGCETQGYTAYACACGETYNSDYVSPLGHNFVNGECTKCGRSNAENCMHMCHRNGIIWRILRIFFRILKLQPVCRCGAAHY